MIFPRGDQLATCLCSSVANEERLKPSCLREEGRGSSWPGPPQHRGIVQVVASVEELNAPGSFSSQAASASHLFLLTPSYFNS